MLKKQKIRQQVWHQISVHCCSFINSTLASWAGKEINLLNQNGTIVIWNRGFAETWDWDTREESEDDNAGLSRHFRQHWVSRGSKKLLWWWCSTPSCLAYQRWHTHAHTHASVSADCCSEPKETRLGHQFPEMCLEIVHTLVHVHRSTSG